MTFDNSFASHVPRQTALGLGSVALANLESANGGDGVLGSANRPATAKRVIFLYMSGGPSHLETFDYKPTLAKHSGEAMPESFTAGQPIAQLQGQQLKCQGPMFEFHKHAESGQEIARYPAVPRRDRRRHRHRPVAAHRPDHHDPAHTVMNTGTSVSGRPSMGSWITYGLGAETSDLPGFVVMTSFAGRNPQPISHPDVGRTGSCPVGIRGVDVQRERAIRSTTMRQPGRASRARSKQGRVVDAVTKLDRASAARRHPQSARSTARISPIRDWRSSMQAQRARADGLESHRVPRHALEMYGATPVRWLIRRRTASPPAASPSAACGSSSSITATGTITATS